MDESWPQFEPMRIDLNWKKPLFYVLLPILVFLAFVGFPPPFAPIRPTKPSQEQSEPAPEQSKKSQL
jgi:hypothetical protein